MAIISDLQWPDTSDTAGTTYETREVLADIGFMSTGTIIKSDGTVKVTSVDNTHTLSSNLTLKAIKVTIDSVGKIVLSDSTPCYGLLEVLYDSGKGFVEFDLYDAFSYTISADKLSISLNDPDDLFHDPFGNSDIYIKILTVI
jgi:hypothetical protein